MAKKDTNQPKETEAQFMSRLDRDSVYRCNALTNAVNRAGQDGGINNPSIDVLEFADVYYNWLLGNRDATEAPILEKARNNKKNGNSE